MPRLAHHSRALIVVASLAALAACTRDTARSAGGDTLRGQPTDSAHAPGAAPAATRPAPDTVAVSRPQADTSAWSASARGIGPVTFGMTVAAAAHVAGGTVAHPPQGSCGFVSLRNVPRGARFMVSYDTVVRVDVDSATVPTDAGARVGMDESALQKLYGSRLRVTPHKYVSGGHYLTFIPGAPADTAHQVVFETDGKRVTRYRAGLAPYVGYVEGCG